MKLLKFGSLILSAAAIVSCSNGTPDKAATTTPAEESQEEMVPAAIDYVGIDQESTEETNHSPLYAELAYQKMKNQKIKVQGSPNIKSFCYALLPVANEYYQTQGNLEEEEENFDMKNGFFESFEEGDGMCKMSCCYWKRTDGKKLVAFFYDEHNTDYTPEEKMRIFSFLTFFLYNEETKELENIEAPFNKPLGLGHLECMLPQEGKDIQYSFWEEGQEERIPHTLKWNGMGFDVQ